MVGWAEKFRVAPNSIQFRVKNTCCVLIRGGRLIRVGGKSNGSPMLAEVQWHGMQDQAGLSQVNVERITGERTEEQIKSNARHQLHLHQTGRLGPISKCGHRTAEHAALNCNKRATGQGATQRSHALAAPG